MEVLNFLHVMLQIWVINMFLDGKFIGLGPGVLNYRDWEHRIADPLETVFPKVRLNPAYVLVHKNHDCVTVE